MNISLILFLIGILGFILNRKNIILMIIAIEIMLLSVTLLVLIMSYGFDDNIGQTFSIYIISIAGAESVIGLSILVAYYRLFTPIISNCLFNNNTLHFVAPSTSFEGESYKSSAIIFLFINKLETILLTFLQRTCSPGTKVKFYIAILYLLLDCLMLRAPL
jgi:NADH-ubiquinone oxidoreductase chain 4L